MPTILKRSTASITRTRCWKTRSQASEPAVGVTYRTNAQVSRAKSGLLSDESLAAVISGSPNSGDDKVARETQYFADPFVAPACALSIGRTDGHIICRREFCAAIEIS